MSVADDTPDEGRRRVRAAGDGSPDAPLDAIDQVEEAWRRERPDIDVSSIGIVSRMWRVARHLERQRNALLAEFGSDRGTIDVLAMLRRAGPPYRRSAGELTRSALITSGGVSQRLDKLERSGLITRHVDVSDRRRVDVELTPAGVELVDSLLADLMSHDDRVLAGALTAAERARLTQLLRKFLRAFEEPGQAEG